MTRQDRSRYADRPWRDQVRLIAEAAPLASPETMAKLRALFAHTKPVERPPADLPEEAPHRPGNPRDSDDRDVPGLNDAC